MADIALTDEQKQELLEELYRMIVEAEGNAVDYDDRSPFETPDTEEEQRRYTVPLIRDAGTADEQAGNINVRDLLEGFGAALVAENDVAAENIQTMQDLAEAFDENATQKTSDFDSHAEEELDGMKQAISGYVNNTSKTEIDSHVNDKQTVLDQHVADKMSVFDDNATSKTSAFNQNAESKQNSFNDTATQKTDAAEQAIADAKDAAIEQIQAVMVSITLGESDYEAL